MRLTFGKYKGLETDNPDVPVSYLAWLEEQDFITDDFRRELQFEIKRRDGDRPGAGKVVKRSRL